MKSIGTLLPNDPTIQPQDELGRMEQRERLKSQKLLQKSSEMIDLWQMMGSLYGHKWVSSYGEEADPDGIWSLALLDVSWEQMQNGFQELINGGSTWPPSAPEFKIICTGKQDHWSQRVHKATTDRQQGQRVIEHKRDPETISAGLAMIQEARKGLK